MRKLTVKDVHEGDSGLYCRLVEMKGWDGGVQTTDTDCLPESSTGKLPFLFFAYFLQVNRAHCLLIICSFPRTRKQMVLINMLAIKHLLFVSVFFFFFSLYFFKDTISFIPSCLLW